MSNNFDSSGYFAYKKNKIQNQIEKPKRRASKIGFLFQLFFATFIIIFIVIVVAIMKYSSKMDIEYTKGELQVTADNFNSIPIYNTQAEEELQRKIDKRLIAIQQEENAPSEAKVLKTHGPHSEVISQEHIESNKRLEKMEKIKKSNEESERRASKLSAFIEDVKPTKAEPIENIEVDDNVIIMSKLLVGRYLTFEEAKKVQNQIKANNPTSQPFVRKVGNIFSVQIGSYQDFAVAKTYAQTLRSKGFDVWIYQQ